MTLQIITVSQISFVLHDCDSFDQYFSAVCCGMSLLVFFAGEFWGGRPQIVCFHHMVPRLSLQLRETHGWCWPGSWAQVCLSGFYYGVSSLPLSLSMLFSVKGSDLVCRSGADRSWSVWEGSIQPTALFCKPVRTSQGSGKQKKTGLEWDCWQLHGAQTWRLCMKVREDLEGC